MKRNQRKFRKGFTLVEMLGVLAIIAILMSIIAVGVLSAINRTRVVATMSNFKNLETAILGFVALPEAAGKLPLTKAGTAANARQKTAGNMATNATLSNGLTTQTQLHLEIPFVSAGLLERNPTWRVGNDGVATGQVDLSQELGWNRSRGCFALTTKEGTAAPTTANDWSTFVRAECAPVDQAAVPGAYHASGMMSADGVNFLIDGSSNIPKGTRVAYVVIPGLSLKDAVSLSEELNGALNETNLTAATPVDFQTKGRFVFAAPAAGDESVTAYYFLANL